MSYQSKSKKASFQIAQDLSSTAEVQFVVSHTSVEDFLTFLHLPKDLVDIQVPLVGLLGNIASVDIIGFVLKQDIYDSSGLYLKSIFFEVTEDSFVKYLPTAVRPSHVAVKVSIFQPNDSTHTIGVEADFTGDVHNYKLSCSFSILPISAVNDDVSSKGYICTCLLTTGEVKSTSSSSMDSLMEALGLESTTKAISSSLPVVEPLLNSIVLKEVSLTYYSGQVSNVDAFYIRLGVTKWNLFSSLSISGFDIQLGFSKASGWSAHIEGSVQFGKEYLISVEFSLPTDTMPGSLHFQNLYEDFTVSKFMTYLGLPALSDVPVLGSLLDISIKNVTLGLETGDSGSLSLYGFKMGMYIGSADMKIFQLSEVNAIVGYNKTPSGTQVSFSVSGFINKKAFVEARYDPKTSEFSGQLLTSTNSILSIDECVSLLISHKGLSQNGAYTAVSNDTSVNVFLNLKYLSDQQGNVVVKEFSINVLSGLTFGPMTLRQLQLLYQNSGDETERNDVTNGSILPVGSSLQLSAVMLQSNGDFGLHLSFDCNVKTLDSKVVTATIQQSSQKSLSLRSFLSLFGLTPPVLPESGANSKPSTDGFLDLQLGKGSLTFATTPFKMMAFEVTTDLSGAGWALLSDPDIVLKSISLSVSYTEDTGISATLYGSVLVGNVTQYR